MDFHWSAVTKSLLVLVFAVISYTLPARDFPERPAAVVLGPMPDGFTFAGAGYAQSAYRANVVMNTRLDKFQVEAFGHHGIVDLPGARMSIYYGTHMLNGPVNPGDSPGAEASQWMMNAIQYEYGLILSWFPPISSPGHPVLLVEYGRRSYHPLRRGFAEPSADILRAGVALMDLRYPRLVPGDLDVMVRFSWSEMYSFWGSDIPDPRVLYTLHLAAEGWVGLGAQGMEAFLSAMPDLLFLRDGGTDMDFTLQGGLRFGSSGAALELFIDYHYSSDTEQLVDRPTPATLLGYGIRLTLRTESR